MIDPRTTISAIGVSGRSVLPQSTLPRNDMRVATAAGGQAFGGRRPPDGRAFGAPFRSPRGGRLSCSRFSSGGGAFAMPVFRSFAMHRSNPKPADRRHPARRGPHGRGGRAPFDPWRPTVAAGSARPPSSSASGLPFALAALVRRSGRGGFHGDVALVTGASRGLGFLIARELGRAGCRLVVCARDADELAHAAADLRRDAEVLALPCDVADRAQVERLVATAVARYGRVDLLVNNAGEIAVGPLSSMDEADFARALDVMLWGTIHP